MNYFFLNFKIFDFDKSQSTSPVYWRETNKFFAQKRDNTISRQVCRFVYKVSLPTLLSKHLLFISFCKHKKVISHLIIIKNTKTCCENPKTFRIFVNITFSQIQKPRGKPWHKHCSAGFQLARFQFANAQTCDIVI